MKIRICSIPCTVLGAIDIQLVFLWCRRRQRLGDMVGLVVYCPMAYDYVPHGRGRTATNVMKEIRRRVEKKWEFYAPFSGGATFCGTRGGY